MADKITQHFLSEERRNQLIASLEEIGMPHALAVDYASFRNELGFVDRNMAFLSDGVCEYCRQLISAVKRRNAEQCTQLRTLLSTHCRILEVYVAEVDERQLHARLPKYTRASNQSHAISDECKRVILLAMIGEGSMH